MRISGGISLFIAAIILVLLDVHTPTAQAAQAKPLVKVVAGYGSTDGAVAPLWFAKETKLFEKRGLDVLLVGMGTGSISLRALIGKDLEIASLSARAWCKPPCRGPTRSLFPPLSTIFSSRFSQRRKLPARRNLKAKN